MKVVLICLAFFLLSAVQVKAAGFHLKSIGGVETGGIQGGKWWHTSSQPTLVGEGSPGSTIDITIDGTLYKADVTSDADWTYTPAALPDGEHSIQFANQGSTFSITLVTGKDKVDWAMVEKGTAQTLPTVGVAWPTLVLLFLGTGGFVASTTMGRRG